MSFNWLKRLFTRQQQDRLLSTIQVMNDQIVNMNDQVTEQYNEQKKNMRRLSLAQKQHSESVEQLAQQFSRLQTALDQKIGLNLSYEQAIQLLDMIHKIRVFGKSSEEITALTDAAINTFLEHTDLTVIAQEGKPYPAEHCDVLNAIPHPHLPVGMVHDIIQQGYRTQTGYVIRPARVVVSRGPVATEEHYEHT